MRDHPHAYGDKKSGEYTEEVKIGSSPRVWGQGYLIPINSAEFRIIPTRMGTSIYHRKLMICIGDHPHAYGDKLLRSKLVLYRLGIIPTRMGTSDKGINLVRYSRDHPHAYGDKYC